MRSRTQWGNMNLPNLQCEFTGLRKYAFFTCVNVSFPTLDGFLKHNIWTLFFWTGLSLCTVLALLLQLWRFFWSHLVTSALYVTWDANILTSAVTSNCFYLFVFLTSSCLVVWLHHLLAPRFLIVMSSYENVVESKSMTVNTSRTALTVLVIHIYVARQMYVHLAFRRGARNR